MVFTDDLPVPKLAQHGGMPKRAHSYGCNACGETFARWAGRCPDCGSMNSIVELRGNEAAIRAEHGTQRKAAQALVLESLSAESGDDVARLSSGISELDRVLGGVRFPRRLCPGGWRAGHR